MSSSSVHHRGWVDLPMELLEQILQRLSLMDNLMNCRATCRSWRKVADAIFSSQLPLLLSLTSSGYVCYNSSQWFESNIGIGVLSAPWSNHDSSLLIESWPSRSSRYNYLRVHSVQGWLMFNNFHYVSDKTFCEISFFNPFSRARFTLPKLFLFLRHPIYRQFRVVFNSAPPGSDEFVVVLLCVFRDKDNGKTKQKLAFFKFKQGSWIELESVVEMNEIFYDIAVDGDDKLYGLSYTRNTSVVFVLNLKDHHHERLVMLNTIEDVNFDGVLYGMGIPTYRTQQLAMDTSTGELLLVDRLEETWSPFRTEGFSVYKLERSGPRWCEVFDIGDRFLFWDDRKVSFVSAKGRLRVPEKFKGGNCIFFSNEHCDPDKGVFFLADRTITLFPINRSAYRSFEDMWFTPAP
ncbi:hypothetical protein PIB30_015334 [Stylosanthes scabra]|uniref:F-box domain-containing protein n=1 Tax=Stylosanthes scabra TaxID=79078 RepID=A0ABU6Q7P9_9FABA|nr:hypothetical protein [Stylosanthes scabra]